MDRIIEVKINGNYLTKDNKNAGVQHEGNVTALRIEFDPGWDGYAKKVTWWDAKGLNPVETTLTTNLLEDMLTSTRIYLVPIPSEPLAEAGACTFVVDGYISGKRQRSIADTLLVKAAPFKENAAEPTDPTPTQAEQLQVQIDTLLDDITEQQTLATTAASTASSKADEAEMHAYNAEVWAVGGTLSTGSDLELQPYTKGSKDYAEEAAASQTAAKASETAAETAKAGAEAAQDAIENMSVEATTLAAGSNATVTKTVDAAGAIKLSYGIPQGVKGFDGEDGTAATVTVGSVTTGEPGTQASVTNSGTGNAAVLDFVIPRGDTGAAGAGTGDMLASVYDPQNKAQDVFAYVDDVAAQASIPVINATSTDGVTYTASVDGITEITAGMTVVMIPNMNSTSTNAKLNINSLGDMSINRGKSGTSQTTNGGQADYIRANFPLLLVCSNVLPTVYAWVIQSMSEPSASDLSGTVSVANGGTGKNTLLSGQALIGNGTNAVTSRVITNNTSISTAINGTTNLVTMNTLRYAINRTTSVAAADTNYTTYMARGTTLNSAETTPAVNGAIAWTYE